MIQTAIVGGGPAGANCAYCLAENDIYPTIFDPSHPREKPCGGLVTTFAQKMFPFLKQIPIEHNIINKINYVFPSKNKLCINLRHGHLGFSRLLLDSFLMNRAIEKGAELIEEKIVALKKKRDYWSLKTEKKTYLAKTLIGADGVNSQVRKKIIGPLSKKDLGFCFGYLANKSGNKDATMVFSPYRQGYIWMIPRGRNTCFGIGTTEISNSSNIRKELDLFILKNYPKVEKISTWAALIPNIKEPKVFRKALAGKNWILIGDAAGHVDPVSGEGISYALLDGKLAAQAIAEDSPELFNSLWMETYGMDLVLSIKMRKWFYKQPITELYFQIPKLFQFLQQLDIS